MTDNNYYWVEAKDRFKIHSIDHTELKPGLLDVHNKDVKHFEGAVKKSDTNLEEFKAKLKLALNEDYKIRAYFQEHFFYWLVNTVGENSRNSFRKVFLLSWQEGGQYSQGQQVLATIQPGKD